MFYLPAGIKFSAALHIDEKKRALKELRRVREDREADAYLRDLMEDAGDINGEDDVHWHYGEGSYNLDKYLARYIAPDALVTMETGGKPAGIQPWINDREYIRRLQWQL